MRVLNPEAIPTRENIQEVWLDRVLVDYTLDDHDMDVIRALCEIAQPTLTVERIYELIDDEMNDLVREALWNVVRHRAAIGEAHIVARVHIEWLRSHGRHTLDELEIADQLGVPVRIVREALMNHQPTSWQQEATCITKSTQTT